MKKAIALSITILILIVSLTGCQGNTSIDKIYDNAGSSNKITTIVMTNNNSNSITITDPAQIESFCDAITATTFTVSKTNDATAPYFVDFRIYHDSEDYWYTLAIPNGRMIRAGTGKKIISPFYTVTDYTLIGKWIEDNFGSDYLNP